MQLHPNNWMYQIGISMIIPCTSCTSPHWWRFLDMLNCHDGKADCHEVLYIFSVRVFLSHDWKLWIRYLLQAVMEVLSHIYWEVRHLRRYLEQYTVSGVVVPTLSMLREETCFLKWLNMIITSSGGNDLIFPILECLYISTNMQYSEVEVKLKFGGTELTLWEIHISNIDSYISQ